jgi:cell division protein FtsB
MFGILKLIASPIASLFGRATNRFGMLNIAILAAGLAFAWLAYDHIRVMSDDLDAARTRAHEAEQSLVDTRATLKAERETHAAEMEALRDERDAEQTRAANAREVLDKIRNAPAEDDAPVAPVLRDTLDALRGRQ